MSDGWHSVGFVLTKIGPVKLIAVSCLRLVEKVDTLHMFSIIFMTFDMKAFGFDVIGFGSIWS